MNPEKVRELLCGVQDRSVSLDEALQALKHLPYEDLGFANVDHHRYLRQGITEVIFCQSKTTEEIVAIVDRLQAVSAPVLATRVQSSALVELKEKIPAAVFYERSSCFTIG